MIVYHATDVVLTDEDKKKIEEKVGYVSSFEQSDWLEPGQIWTLDDNKMQWDKDFLIPDQPIYPESIERMEVRVRDYGLR